MALLTAAAGGAALEAAPMAFLAAAAGDAALEATPVAFLTAIAGGAHCAVSSATFPLSAVRYPPPRLRCARIRAECAVRCGGPASTMAPRAAAMHGSAVPSVLLLAPAPTIHCHLCQPPPVHCHLCPPPPVHCHLRQPPPVHRHLVQSPTVHCRLHSSSFRPLRLFLHLAPLSPLCHVPCMVSSAPRVRPSATDRLARCH